MAKKAAIVVNHTVNSVALETRISSITRDMKQETVKVDGLGSTGPERVVGNYDWGTQFDGAWDGASGNVDATLAGLIGNAGVSTDLSPTGAVAGANDPHYTGTEVLASYSIKAAVGQAVTYSASMEGASAQTRAVA